MRGTFSGQSAIEYLMTYGWMLLVVAVVGGAIFSVVQGDIFGPSVQISGFDDGDVIITDSDVGDESLELVVRNGGSENLEVEKITISNPDSKKMVLNSFTDVGVGNEEVLGLTNISSDSEGEFELEVQYTQGNLEGLVESGTITGDLEIPENGELWDDPYRRNACGEIIEEMWVEDEEVYQINNLAELQCMSEDKEGEYSLERKIDAQQTEAWESGFHPLGDPEEPFRASINGNSNVIEGLAIERPETDRVGLVGYGDDMTVEYLKLNNTGIIGDHRTGALGGDVRNSLIYKTYANGEVVGGSRKVGVLLGAGSGTHILKSHTSGYSEGPGRRTAGIVGRHGTVNQSYSEATVNGGRSGGIAGRAATIVDSYYTGEIDGASVQTGGIQGRGSSVNRTFTVNPPNDGAEGEQRNALIGRGGAEYSYWNEDLCPDCDGTRSDSPTAKGLTTEEMKGDAAAENMEGFDFENVWRTVEDSYPKLKWQ